MGENTGLAQLERLQARYEGTGHPDTSRDEWLATQHRDTNALLLGNGSLVEYLSLAQGQHRQRTRLQLIDGMVDPLAIL